MATVTHYIRSEYDAEADKDRLLRETGQVVDDALDPWQTESFSAGFHTSRRLANAPKFVPALLSYDEWGNVSNPPTNAESTPTPSDSPHGGDVASWYRSLSREAPNPARPQQKSESQSHSGDTRHRTRAPGATPEPSSSSPSITAPAPSSPIHATGTLASSALVESRRRHRSGHDWFISRAISQSQSTSAPPSPRPSDSLADILSRYGPSTEPIRPPVFLHLGPSNKGWVMLQNKGWSEGEGLGTGSKSNDAHAKKETLQTKKEKGKKRMRFDSQSPSASASAPASLLPTSTSLSQERATIGEQEDEILIDDDDDDPIVEIRKKAHVPMIDLTQSDTESDDEGEDEGEEEDENNNDDTIDENDEDEDDLNSHAPTSPATQTEKTGNSDDPRSTQTALLTPLPTVLKSDRLGIGLKAKTEGPYRSSVKRVTHNAAALAAHVKAAEDRRRTQRLLGKGRRAFARADRLERERRQNMMAYLSKP